MIRTSSDLIKLFHVEGAFEEDIEEALDHALIVSNLAYYLSKEAGLTGEECLELAAAGSVHDIGKLKVGSYLYGRNEGALRIEEIKYVRMHPTLGFEMLKEVDYASDKVLSFVYHHHENYDGTGYPDNLAGEAIPLGARIIRICDVFAALISQRPYRTAFELDSAIELMIDEVKNFDMQLFLSFMKLVHSDVFEEIYDYVSLVNQKVYMKNKEDDYGRINEGTSPKSQVC